MLSTPTLSVTKTIANFCTWAKRCCVTWLPSKSLFSDTEGVEGDGCERVHVHTHTNKKAQNSHLTGAGAHVPCGGDTALQMAVLRLQQFPSWAALWLMTINCSGSHLKFTFQMVGERAVALEQCGTCQLLHWQSPQSSSHTCYGHAPCSHSAEETGKKDRPSILFKTFKKLIDKN